MITAPPRRRGELAIALQEAFTVGVRLRDKRQIASTAAAFRTHVKQLLTSADRQARDAGYSPEQVRLAIYAYIAFLDEAVLSSTSSMFADWGRQPLQEEVFGDHIAGETFFENLTDLLGRNHSEDLADVLEVYQLAMLLGFRGKYTASPGALQTTLMTVQDRIRRVRGRAPLSPSWAPPEGEATGCAHDPWLPRLAAAAGAAALLASLLFVLFRLNLAGQVGQLTALISRLAP